jgi:hypothetical protein
MELHGQQQLELSFLSITGLEDTAVAQQYLSKADFDLNRAVNFFFNDSATGVSCLPSLPSAEAAGGTHSQSVFEQLKVAKGDGIASKRPGLLDEGWEKTNAGEALKRDDVNEGIKKRKRTKQSFLTSFAVSNPDVDTADEYVFRK